MMQPQIPNPLIIASRGSMLALWQANYVKSMFESPTQQVEIKIIKTTGDRVQDRFLHEIGGKGLFIRELEQALQNNEAHIAVHSLKDLPAKIPVGFKLAAIHKRHQPTDILIFNPKKIDKFNIPNGEITSQDFANFGNFTVATGSLRRTALLKEASHTVNVVPIRGNVDTRIQKLLEGDWDGLILAEASLERLNLREKYITRRLSPKWFTPSAAQGALAIETLDHSHLDLFLQKFVCTKTTICVEMERSLLEQLGGDCTMPFGCFFYMQNDRVFGDSVILNNLGQTVRASIDVAFDSNFSKSKTVSMLLNKLIEKGAEKILKDLNIVAPFMK